MLFVHHEVSEKQVAANQANAHKSTGPRTEQGKRRVRLNGLKHGLRCSSFRESMKCPKRAGAAPAGRVPSCGLG